MKNDKPFWVHVGQILAHVGLKFRSWPFPVQVSPSGDVTSLQPFYPPVGAVGALPCLLPPAYRVSANDEITDPSPEAA